MSKKIKSVSYVVILAIIFSMVFTNYSNAEEISNCNTSENNEKFSTFAGEEVLGLGEYFIGNFTFTNTNLTSVKTIPAGGNTLQLKVRFRKSSTDIGVGQVKLTVRIQDIDDNVLTSKTVNAASGTQYTTLTTNTISVRAGQKIRVFFDASSVNPSESNGHYRTIQVGSFMSYVY